MAPNQNEDDAKPVEERVADLTVNDDTKDKSDTHEESNEDQLLDSSMSKLGGGAGGQVDAETVQKPPHTKFPIFSL